MSHAWRRSTCSSQLEGLHAINFLTTVMNCRMVHAAEPVASTSKGAARTDTRSNRWRLRSRLLEGRIKGKEDIGRINHGRGIDEGVA